MLSAMLLAVAQIYTAPISQPQERLVLMQAAEGEHPVPLCDEQGKNCLCPIGYLIMQQQSIQTIGAQIMTCAPQQGMGLKRARDKDYPAVPRPVTYGQ